MKQYLIFPLLIILSVSSSIHALESSDQKNIKQIIEHFTNAWNYHEGHGCADYYTEDADFVNIFGMAFTGKQEIEIRHIEILKTIFKGSLFEVVNLRLREAKPGIVIAQTYWKVTNIKKPGSDILNEIMKGIFTHVFLKDNDKWEITATQNTSIAN